MRTSPPQKKNLDPPKYVYANRIAQKQEVAKTLKVGLSFWILQHDFFQLSTVFLNIFPTAFFKLIMVLSEFFFFSRKIATMGNV